MTTLLARLILLGGLLASPAALAQSYPGRNVTIVVTSAPGGLTDVLTRGISQRLSQKWNQSIIVENRGGAGHNFAATVVKAATPDGYTLLASETGMVTIQPHLHSKGKLPYDAEADFTPVSGYATIPMALLANPSVPANSVRELVALAKEKPGGVNYGTAGLGTAPHMGALLLESMTGTRLTAVHYRGAAPALNDVIGGHINFITMGPSIALPTVRDGKLKMLGFGSVKRVPQFPDVPTIAESIPGYEASVSFGLFAPTGTPREIVAKINADVQQVIADPEFRTKFLDPQVVQPLPGSADAYAASIKDESAKWAKVIKDANLKID